MNNEIREAIINYWESTQKKPNVRDNVAAKAKINQVCSTELAAEIIADLDENEISEDGIFVYAVTQAIDWVS